MALTILDPTNEAVPLERKITPRPDVIKGKVAFLDISKPVSYTHLTLPTIYSV